MGKEERFNYYINKKDDRDWFIDDRVKEEEITTFKGVVQVLNQQDQRISELEEQLKNAIMPKFKIGQKVLAVVWEDFIGEKYNYRIIKGTIDHLFINRDNEISYGTMCQSFRSENLFTTEEEAKLKLEELESNYDKLHKTNKLR